MKTKFVLLSALFAAIIFTSGCATVQRDPSDPYVKTTGFTEAELVDSANRLQRNRETISNNKILRFFLWNENIDKKEVTVQELRQAQIDSTSLSTRNSNAQRWITTPVAPKNP